MPSLICLPSYADADYNLYALAPDTMTEKQAVDLINLAIQRNQDDSAAMRIEVQALGIQFVKPAYTMVWDE